MIPLSVRSAFSLLEGVETPGKWVEAVQAHKRPAMALTDRETLAGIVPFVQAAEAAGIHPITGTTLTMGGGDPGIVLLVRDGYGWRGLSRAISAWRAGNREKGWQEVIHAGESLIALPGSDLWLAKSLRVAAWQNGEERLYARVVPPDSKRVPRLHGERINLLDMARKHRVPLVAATDAVTVSPAGLTAHRVVRAMATLTTVHRLQDGDTAPDSAIFPDDTLAERFSHLPGAVENSYRIAENCRFVPNLGKPLFPAFSGDEPPEEILTRRTLAGLERRYHPTVPMEALRRTRRELEVIKSMGYSSYFLVVHEIVREAVRRGMPILGRGSAANSTVAYCLGITHVDPVAHHLFFERFLNPERLDPPDIDLDLPWDRREEMLQFVIERFGQEHVALVGAFQTFKTRGLFREIGRTLGIPPAQLDRFAKRLPWGSLHHLEEALASDHPLYRGIPLDKPPWRGMIAVAKKLAGLPRHFGIHPCGIAVAGVPVRDVLPVVPSPCNWPATDGSMGPVEDLGLIKIDLLGNRSMGALCDALLALDLRDETDPEGGLAPEIAMDDPATNDLIARGDTVGCFYIESPSMRGVLKRLECRNFETLVAASSIIRPGVNQGGLMDAFIRRHRGEEIDSYPDPRLRPFLTETHGILVYQEQVIQTVSAVAGMSLGEGDLFRRAMGKKRHHENLRIYEDRFRRGALAGGMAETAVSALWQQIASFAGYAFCKAHSASFARLSYQMAWLRTHHPALFFACVLSHQGGYYHPQVYVDSARRLGVRILPPCVVEGRWQTQAVDNGTIRMGLQWVRGVGREPVDRILDRRPYTGWDDFLHRVSPDREAAAMLVLSGATDQLDGPVNATRRRDRLWAVECYQNTRQPIMPTLIFPEESQPTQQQDPHPVPPERLEERLCREVDAMGLALADHPLRLYRAWLLPEVNRILPARRWNGLPEGTRAICVGLPVARKSLLTKKGELMSFLTLSDRTGLIETVLFPKIVQHIGARLKQDGPWRVEGIMRQGSMVVERIYSIGQTTRM